jgi:hypothetical protein
VTKTEETQGRVKAVPKKFNQEEVRLIPYYEYDPAIHNIEYRYFNDFQNVGFSDDTYEWNTPEPTFGAVDYRYFYPYPSPYYIRPRRRRRRRRYPYYFPMALPVPLPAPIYPYYPYYGSGYRKESPSR